MTTSRPASLTPPSLEAYPFIDVMFRHLLLGIAHHPININEKCRKDNSFADEHFKSPESVRIEQIAPLQAMTDKTLNRLLCILRPKIFGDVITTKRDFDLIIAVVYEQRHLSDNAAACTFEQMAAFQLKKAHWTESAHWGMLADLYNESTADQQEAIHQLFEKCLNRNLEYLLVTPAPEVTLPESLRESFETKVEDGQTFLYSEVEQQWLREDAFNQIYSVQINYKGSADPDLLIATAPTVSQAIAMATLYINDTSATLAGGNKVTIRHNFDLATADIESLVGRNLNHDFSINEKVKLIWNLEKVGIYTGNYEIIRDNTAALIENCDPDNQDMLIELEKEHQDCIRMIAALSSDTVESFTKTVLSVEKALGIQWGKVHILEDALGL